MAFKEDKITEEINSTFNNTFRWCPNNDSFGFPLKVRIGFTDEEQKIHDRSRLDMLEDINKLLNHKIINVNKEELDAIIDYKIFFKQNNTLCIQTDENGTYWIKFDDDKV